MGRSGWQGEREAALLRRLWSRNHRTASVMDQFYGRARRTMPTRSSAKPAAKFVKVHCVAGHGRMSASGDPESAFHGIIGASFRMDFEGNRRSRAVER